MGTVQLIHYDGIVERVIMNGENLDSDDGHTFYLPKGLAKGIRVSDLPADIVFDICDRVEKGIVFIDSTPFSITVADDGRLRVTFEDCGRRKYWDADVGFKKYMETKRDIVLEREKEVGDVRYEHYDDDGDYIVLSFCTYVDVEGLDDAISIGEQILAEIEGAVEQSTGSLYTGPQPPVHDETSFTLHVLVPLLRRLGFSDVRYNHGNTEFGKDVLFVRRTEFGDNEQWGCQAKYGNVAGGANSQVDELIGQIEDSFTLPFYNVYTLRRERISKLLIAITGKFTHNAVQKICEKLRDKAGSAVANNVLFIDGDRIDSLIQRFRK